MNIVRTVSALAFVLTQASAEVAPPTPRYSTIAACEAVLLNLRRQVPKAHEGDLTGIIDLNARRITPSLDRIAAITEPPEYGIHDDLEDRQESAREEISNRNKLVQEILRKPNYRAEDSFAVTEVYTGQAAIERYLENTEAYATDLEDKAFASIEPQLFSRQKRKQHILTLLGFAGALSTEMLLVSAIPIVLHNYLSLPLLPQAMIAGGLGLAGGVGIAHLLGQRSAWAYLLLRAHFRPGQRRPLIDQLWNFDSSVYFDSLRAMIKSKQAADKLRERLPLFENLTVQTGSGVTLLVPTTHVNSILDSPDDQLEAASVDFLAGRRGLRIPKGILPINASQMTNDGRRTKIELFNILFLDPKTKDINLIVHARGELEKTP